MIDELWGWGPVPKLILIDRTDRNEITLLLEQPLKIRLAYPSIVAVAVKELAENGFLSFRFDNKPSSWSVYRGGQAIFLDTFVQCFSKLVQWLSKNVLKIY